MKCPNCHLELTYNANFCSNCGNRVISCSRCRNYIEKTDKFCRNCGFENKDLGQEEQCVDDDCSYGGDTWNPPKRDISKQQEAKNYAECIEGSHSKEIDTREIEQISNEKSIKTTDSSKDAESDRHQENQSSKAQCSKVLDIQNPVNSDQHLKERPVDAETIEETDLKKLEQELTNHKHQHLSMAIAGDTCVGKSTFIYIILNNKKGDENYAETGLGNTTMEPKRYCHPRNANFTISDMPGYGTSKMPMKKFVELANLSQFDYFFIFFHPVLREVDMRMAEILKEHNIPFALVRTKLDLDLKREKPKGKTETTEVIDTLRRTIIDETKCDEHFSECKVFLISNEPAYLATCDMTSLIRDIADKLTEDKYEAFLLQLGFVNPKTIDMKYKELKKRIPSVARTCALIAASWIPLIDIVQNYNSMVEELNTYVQSFGLDKDFVPSVPGVKSTFSRSKIRTINWKVFLSQGFSQIARAAMAAGISQVDFVIPIAGSAVSGISTLYIVSTFLKGHLDELQEDALTVYQHFNKST